MEIEAVGGGFDIFIPLLQVFFIGFGFNGWEFDSDVMIVTKAVFGLRI